MEELAGGSRAVLKSLFNKWHEVPVADDVV